MRGGRAALLACAVAAAAGCATPPSFLRTDELMPAARSGASGETEFFVRLEAFLDERGDRTSVGSAGGRPLVTDRDVVEVFEKITARALERKGIRPGSSPLSVRGTVRVANVGSLADVGGEGVRVARSNLGARVEMQLEVFNPASKAVLWRKEFQGRGAGGDYGRTLAAAFQDLSNALDREDGPAELKGAYLAAGGRPAQTPAAGPAPETAAAGPASDADKPPRRGRRRPGDFALIIGIEKYQNLPGVPYAERDAVSFKNYARDTLGVPEENIILLTGAMATRTGVTKYLEEWLPRNVGEGARVYFYYSGHGSPEPADGTAYLLPWDGDASFLQSSAIPLKALYRALSALKAKEVVAALDSCFSGAGGRSVVAKGARPLVHMTETAVPAKLTVLTAASGAEIAGSLDEQGHGIFTYFLLKGLQGEAAAGGRLALSDLFSYVRENVQRTARRQNREQTPQIIAPSAELDLY